MIGFELGLLFSTTGPYAALGKAAMAGARLAIDDLARDGIANITADIRDPEGRPENYERLTGDILASGRVRHVVGAITSWSRKDIIPVLERNGALLWYPCPYEGFECNDHVVYLGASPNHHMVPLADRLAPTVRRVYLVGSNYVWGWETLRLARERFGAAGVEIVGERYVPLGSDACDLALDEIAATSPDVVVNSLIGPSNAAFMAALARHDCGGPLIVSCNQTEADLDTLGAAAEGLLSAGAFFEALGPKDFVDDAARVAPNGRCSSFLATSYASVRILAASVAEAGSDDPRRVFNAATSRWRDTVLGPIRIDPVTRHASLTPHIARVEAGRFTVESSAPRPVSADPYLTRQTVHKAPRREHPEMRLVK